MNQSFPRPFDTGFLLSKILKTIFIIDPKRRRKAPDMD
jgi:hypothetical protein